MIITIPVTSKGGDDTNDLENNHHLMSMYSSTVQETLHTLYVTFTNLKYIKLFSFFRTQNGLEKVNLLFQPPLLNQGSK